jgi:hypothetical protein
MRGLCHLEARFVNFRSTSVKAASAFVVQGFHFVGTTVLAVNGTAASFEVRTANFIGGSGQPGQFGEDFGYECGYREHAKTFTGAISQMPDLGCFK